MLVGKRGVFGFYYHRFVRILIPFLLFTFFYSYLFSWFGQYQFGKLTSHKIPLIIFYSPHHLWFLGYLFLISLVVASFVGLWKKLDRDALKEKLELLASQILFRWWSPLLFAMPGALLLWNYNSFSILQPATLGKNFSIIVLVYYLAFFVAGWLIHWRRLDLQQLTRFGILFMLGAILIRIVTYLLLSDLNSVLKLTSESREVLLAITSSVFSWLMVFGLIGLFTQFSWRDGKISRFLSDSIYWVYIIHLLPVVAFQYVFAYAPIPALTSYLLTCLGSLIFCLVTYRFMVRKTLIGKLLNGPR